MLYSVIHTGNFATCTTHLTNEIVQQEAQLPQKNSASAAHIYLGWLADLLMNTHTRLVVQCTVYGKIADVVLFLTFKRFDSRNAHRKRILT